MVLLQLCLLTLQRATTAYMFSYVKPECMHAAKCSVISQLLSKHNTAFGCTHCVCFNANATMPAAMSFNTQKHELDLLTT